MLVLQFDDLFQIEDVINKKFKKYYYEVLVLVYGFQIVVDGFLVIGIVVVVLGVIKIMGLIDKFLVVLGEMIGGVFVGIFFGVFLVYCFVVFLFGCLIVIEEQDGVFYNVICDIFVVILYDYSLIICVEIGCGNILIILQLSFYEMEEVCIDLVEV